MTRSVLKRLAASCFEPFGFEVRRLPEVAGRDPFLFMQQALGEAASPLILDVGANVGQSLLRFRELWPQAVIHAFEPGRRSFAELERQTAGMPRVHLNQMALGAAAGSAEFCENSQGDMSSLLEMASEAWGKVVDRYAVPLTTLDSYAAERSIDRIDILKIDTQGFDLHVLQGALGSLGRGRIRFVLLEMIFADLYEGQARVDEVFKLLLDQRMRLVGMYDFHFVKGMAGWADALFAGPG